MRNWKPGHHPRIVAVHLNGAAAHRLRAQVPAAERRAQGDYLKMEDYKYFARSEILKARRHRLGQEAWDIA